MADVKTVRLVNDKTGVVVETSEENAGRLAGFSAEGKKSKGRTKPEAAPAADSADAAK